MITLIPRWRTHAMISSKTYHNQIDQLQKAFKQQYTEEQLKRLFTSLQGKGEGQLKKGIDWLILNKTRLPFPGEVINAVEEERSKEWRENKFKEERETESFFEGKTYRGEMAKEALKLIKLAINKEITKPELYKKMIEMDTLYLDKGWKVEAHIMMAERTNA
jgi:hypothetical protein